FVSYPNTDPGNKNIIDVIKKYENNNNFVFYKNLERKLFLSIYKNSMFLIGNSSSGIMEAASIPIPVINVGLRQTGRLANDNVIFCNTDRGSIDDAIKKAISDEFKKKVSQIKNIYGEGKSSEKAYKIIKKIIKGNYLQKLSYKKEDILEII
ncbi:MAG: UDP-N-acetylglucosamine 2-epimerase, partial [Actinomycetota bacterium]|nr:UDP-N-acetylglucosamine 2-epimerase [Actinomycetota bacterium]